MIDPRFKALLVGACLMLAGCSGGGLMTKPGVYDAGRQRIAVRNRQIPVTYVRPTEPRHPEYFIVFATGDGGWFGPSAAVFEHLAEQGYLMAGFSSPEALRRVERKVSAAEAAASLATVFAQVRRDLAVPATVSMIVVGFSRGASMVAFTAVHQQLRVGLAGAIAIGLTRESDELLPPEGAEHALGFETGDDGLVQIYPALSTVRTTRLAVIQSTNDGYVPAAESRTLLGPDTAARRLYAVAARNHRFGGARDELLRDLDDALAWIEETAPRTGAAR